MKTFFFYLSSILIGLWAQILLNHMMGGSGVTFQVLLVAVIYWGLTRGPLVGQMMGLGWGLLIDAASLGLLGLHGFLWAIMGYTAGVFRRQLDETKPWTQTIFTFILSLIYSGSVFLLQRLFSPGERSVSMNYILQPFANALIAAALFGLLRSWERVWDIPRVRD